MAPFSAAAHIGPLGVIGTSSAAVGALVALARIRSFAKLPQLFIKVDAGGSVPTSEAGALHTGSMVALLWGGNKLVDRLLKLVGLGAFPSSIAALLLAYLGLSTVDVVAGEAASDRAANFFKPGVDFLGRWMIAV
jgi:hypothetical protein